MSYSVFISHATKDTNIAQWIKSHSESIGIKTYLFEEDLQLGTSISQKVKKEIEASDSVLVLLTGNSQSSAYVHQEIGVAEGLGKLIIPLVFPGFEQKNLAMLQEREYVQFNPNNSQVALGNLLNFLVKRKRFKEGGQAIVIGLGSLVLLSMFFGEK